MDAGEFELATRAQISLAWVLGERGEWKQAHAAATDAVAMARELRDLAPGRPAVELADALVVLMVNALTAGIAEPPDAAREARAVMLDALDDDPYDSRVLAALVRADDLVLRYDPAALDALLVASEAVDLSRRIRALEPTNVRFVIAQLGALEMQATALALVGERAESLARYREGLGVAQTIARMEPDNVDNVRAVAYMHDRVGDCLMLIGDPASAEHSYRESIALLEQVNASAPWEGSRIDLGSSHTDLGTALEGLGRRAEAMQEYEAAIAIGDRLTHVDGDTVTNAQLAEALVAATDLEREDRERSRRRAARAIELLESAPHLTSGMVETLDRARALLR